MVRFLSHSEATLGCVRRRARSHRRVQADTRALARAQMHALGNRLDRQCRLRLDARRYSKLGWNALAPREQVSLFPAEPAQLLGDAPSFFFVLPFDGWREASVRAAEPSFRSGVSAERRHIRKLSPAALCRDAATPRFLAPTPCHPPSLRHD